MRRQLQIQNGFIHAEWSGDGGLPIPPDDSWIFLDVTDRPDAQMGMRYDSATDTFIAPEPVVLPSTPDYGRLVTTRDFFDLLTFDERRVFRATAATNPAVEDFLFSLQLPSPIYLRHPSTLEGLATLVAEGVLTAERRDAIIA